MPGLSVLRRRCLLAGFGLPFWPKLSTAKTRPALQFPRDLGSHPDFAIEWWYVTGQLQAAQRQFGFQLTFFRTRVASTQAMRSRLAAKQLIFAHVGVTDVAGQRLWHEQRMARASGAAEVDLALCSETDTQLLLGDWHLQRQNDAYQAQASGPDFRFALSLQPTQALLLQGEQGWSRKGPDPQHGSFYYSLPQLAASGQLQLGGQTMPVKGMAWLDHEWSQSLLAPEAIGWDWIGMNLTDGSALTAFRLRTQSGAPLWAGGSFRAAGQAQADIFGPDAVHFTPLRRWTSAASGATYPVHWWLDLRTKAASTPQRWRIQAVIDNQELDSRQTTGAIYWEGLSELFDSRDQLIGRGYLEMTGYASPLRL